MHGARLTYCIERHEQTLTSYLPLPALTWISSISMLGALTGVLGAAALVKLPPSDWAVLALFALAVLLADLYRVRFPAFHIELSVSTVLVFGAVLAFDKAAVVLALGSLAADMVLRKPVTKGVFNAATYSIISWSSATIWGLLKPPGASTDVSLLNSGQVALAWIASGASLVLMNALIVTVVVALVDRSTVRNVFKSSLSGIIVQLLTLPTLGVLVAVLYNAGPLSLVLVTLPLLAVYYSLRSVQEIRRQALATVERLSDVLDRRDPATEQHSQRVAGYTRRICEEMSLPTDFIETATMAARVHDLGKIAVPDAILFKPGGLTEEEWAIMRRHPDDAAEILSSMQTYAAGVAIIRHHHERWDGSGYPSALSGEDIPLGARILAVADAYDAMVSNRAYRRAIHKHTVMEEIHRLAGRQFDPAVVAAFLSVMEAAAPGVLCLPPAKIDIQRN